MERAVLICTVNDILRSTTQKYVVYASSRRLLNSLNPHREFLFFCLIRIVMCSLPAGQNTYIKSVENNLITAVLSFTQCIKLTNIGETRPDICLRAIPREV